MRIARLLTALLNLEFFRRFISVRAPRNWCFSQISAFGECCTTETDKIRHAWKHLVGPHYHSVPSGACSQNSVELLLKPSAVTLVSRANGRVFHPNNRPEITSWGVLHSTQVFSINLGKSQRSKLSLLHIKCHFFLLFSGPLTENLR